MPIYCVEAGVLSWNAQAYRSLRFCRCVVISARQCTPLRRSSTATRQGPDFPDKTQNSKIQMAFWTMKDSKRYGAVHSRRDVTLSRPVRLSRSWNANTNWLPFRWITPVVMRRRLNTNYSIFGDFCCSCFPFKNLFSNLCLLGHLVKKCLLASVVQRRRLHYLKNWSY